MRKNIVALSMGALAAAVMLTGCFDGPSAPANEGANNQEAVGAIVVHFKRVNISFSIPKKTDNAFTDGYPTAVLRCKKALPTSTKFYLVSATTSGTAQGIYWAQSWNCYEK